MDLNDCFREGENELIKDVQLRMISNLNGEIEKIEKQLFAIIQEDENVKNREKSTLRE